MRKTFNKYVRDNLESAIQQRFKSLYPHFDM